MVLSTLTVEAMRKHHWRFQLIAKPTEAEPIALTAR
jgi:hypothetical protein